MKRAKPTSSRITELPDDYDERKPATTEELEMPVLDALIYLIPLSFLHLMLDILVHQQYLQEYTVREVAWRTLRAIPVLGLIRCIVHRLPPRPRQFVFFLASVASGLFLIHSTNNHGYYHVMKKAPSLGTLWVWSVVESELSLAIASLGIAGGYMYFWEGGSLNLYK
ncbi:hypothetical protein SAICODRAFT_64308 [Saitoella complicata NRRL Y-17804]|uniref:uncharacterized protein n=1 Tax=Saitoella complicata (strain BCRC 22490 / CBS 7301 / JCM 7358 / NBRC 10748 / NRRL Y-17804) TaxID=698492 RepID=UPI000867267B|nr:uncharacterized protein SAICODRAFT_64308 [Saitoella complicata NRRL Y-17804]ODQ55069.1 hypothetical protein SAICODRAFT_64308 [Saitoella complicata NRRL Y-17804]